jgi:hypothetical protein
VWTCDTCGKEIARTYQMGLRPDIKFGERVLTDTIVKGVYETD